MEMNKELLAKAKNAKTVEELAEIAKENNFELTEESAKAYFELLHPQTGELADEELDNVSGGGCYKGNRLIITEFNSCDDWICEKCKVTFKRIHGSGANSYNYYCACIKCGGGVGCTTCKFRTYEKGLWLCNNPKRMRK